MSHASPQRCPPNRCKASSGNVYVSQIQSGAISKFNSSGSLLNASFASIVGQAYGLAFDHSGNLFVANSSNGTVSEFNSSGTLLNGSFISGLHSPYFLAFDNSGNLFVSDDSVNNNLNKVLKFDSSGTLLNASFASGVSYPTGLAFDLTGNLYVANSGNKTITEFNPSGTLINTISVPGQFVSLTYLAFSPEPAPEPSTLALASLGVASLFAYRRKFTK